MKESKRLNILKRIYKNKKLLIIIVIFLAAGLLIWKYISSKRNANVETAEVKRGSVFEELVLSGEINAVEYAKLTFPTSGKIAWVGVGEGDEVKKGQALMKLDTVVLNTAFQQAKAALRAAEATVERVHDQVKDHAADETFTQKDTRTTAEAAKDEAYEAYVAAEYNLRNSTLRAPFSGINSYVAHPYPGVNILATEIQVEIINPDTVYFDVSADQTEVGSLALGQKVRIVLDAISDNELSGTVVFIGYTPKIGEVGAVYKVKVKFDTNLDIKRYRIGMSGDAKFILSENKDVLYLPPKFIKSDTNGKYIKKNAKNDKTYVEVGLEGEDRVEVKGDIKEGDIVYD